MSGGSTSERIVTLPIERVNCGQIPRQAVSCGTGVAQVQEPWIERWHEGRIGWHEAEGSASLRKFWRANDRDVLVPLCGKSKDLRWLADQGNRIIGVELSELAVRAFFEEQALEYTVTDGRLPAYKATEVAITIYCGDYLDLTQVQCNAHYVRGTYELITNCRCGATDNYSGLRRYGRNRTAIPGIERRGAFVLARSCLRR